MWRNDYLERNRDLVGRQNDYSDVGRHNNTFFDRGTYKSQIRKLLIEEIRQKEKKRQFRNGLRNDKPLLDSKQKLIIEITWEEKLDIDNIKITKEKLERINENKALILEITWEEKITIYSLINRWEELGKITKEELERINENKALILEITWEEKITMYDLIRHWKELSEINRKQFEDIKKNKKLIEDIIVAGKITIMDLKKLSEISEEWRKNMKKNIKLIQEFIGNSVVFATDIKELSEINRKQFEDIKKNKELIQEIIRRKIDIWNLKYLSKITGEWRKNIRIINQNTGTTIPFFSDCKTDWLFDSECWDHKWYGEYLSKLDEETIDYCKIHDIKELRMIVMVDKIIKNSRKIRGYVKRKQEYLKKNRLLNDSEFERLFWGIWKYGKWEINQTGLWYCYLYTAYEILKKMNFFEVLVKTNLKKNESGDGWCVKLPMWQPDWQWISVSENEIDKEFDVPYKKEWLIKRVSINSDSPLWFKIMEIAYIKKELINRDKNASQEFLDNWDVLLTWERLSKLEGGETSHALNVLMWDNIINQRSRRIKGDKWVDIVFDNFGKWLIVDLGVKIERNPINEVELDIYWETNIGVVEKDVKIINKHENIPIIRSGFIKKDDKFELIYGENRSNGMLNDIIDLDEKKQVVFHRGHSYSLERCYIDEDTWEKRVQIVNPRHTWIKFDMSLEIAKRIFDWSVSYIDVDKLFR